MKKTYQKPIDIDKQIENLKTIDLEINDINYAKQVLKRISYYRLIKAYSITLKEKGKYVKGTKFEDIVNLYKFDVELRHLIFIVIEYVEVALRAEITNHFSLKYGNFGYQEIANFDKEEEQKKEYLKQHISNNTLIATIINLKIISEEEKYKNFYDSLLKLTEKYNNIDLKHIGFPKDFNEILCI